MLSHPSKSLGKGHMLKLQNVCFERDCIRFFEKSLFGKISPKTLALFKENRRVSLVPMVALGKARNAAFFLFSRSPCGSLGSAPNFRSTPRGSPQKKPLARPLRASLEVFSEGCLWGYFENSGLRPKTQTYLFCCNWLVSPFSVLFFALMVVPPFPLLFLFHHLAISEVSFILRLCRKIK